MIAVVDGRHGPGEADAEEDVDSVAARHVAHRGVRVLILDSSHFTGERVCEFRGASREAEINVVSVDDEGDNKMKYKKNKKKRISLSMTEGNVTAVTLCLIVSVKKS